MLFSLLISGASVTCIARCKTNGNLVLPWTFMNEQTCASSEHECMQSFTGKAPNGNSYGIDNCKLTSAQEGNFMSQLQVYFLKFSTPSKCETYAKDVIKSLTAESAKRNATSLKSGQCGCQESVRYLLEQGKLLTGIESSFCKSVASKMNPANRACKNLKGPVEDAICGSMIGFVADKLDEEIFIPFCDYLVQVIKVSTGFEIGNFYAGINIESEKVITRIAEESCGNLTCNQERSEVCRNVANGKGIMSAVSSYLCKNVISSESGFMKSHWLLTGVCVTVWPF